ncbi:MAG: peptidoglycan-binding domain-containing protein [Patescibacteria group bacterium]
MFTLQSLKKEMILSALSLVILFSGAVISTVTTQAQVTGTSATVVTTTTGPVGAYGITVTSPNGGETLLASSSQTISWINASSSPVDIYLLPYQAPCTTTICPLIRIAPIYIAQNVSGGSYFIQDITSIPIPLNKYRAEVCLAGTFMCDVSDDYFTVTTSTQTTSSCYVFSNNLTVGSTGADVTALQQFLSTNGFLSNKFVTGYFGPQTVDAVKLYQTSVGLPSYGFVGPITREKLNAACVPIDTDKDGGAKSIKLLNPNGNEKWMSGSRSAVKWSAPHASVSDLMDIKIASYLPPCITPICPRIVPTPLTVISGISATTHSYEWVTGQLQNGYSVPAGKYTMQICITGITPICDTGKTYFSITAPVVTTSAAVSDAVSNMSWSGVFNN